MPLLRVFVSQLEVPRARVAVLGRGSCFSMVPWPLGLLACHVHWTILLGVRGEGGGTTRALLVQRHQ